MLLSDRPMLGAKQHSSACHTLVNQVMYATPGHGTRAARYIESKPKQNKVTRLLSGGRGYEQ